jgi:hypothetical protein
MPTVGVLPNPSLQTRSSVGSGETEQIGHRVLGRDPALKREPARARHREQIPIPHGLRGVSGQGAVGAMVLRDLLSNCKEWQAARVFTTVLAAGP